MFRPEFDLRSFRSRAFGVMFGVVSSLSVLSAVVVVFASASGELDPVVARLKAAPAASGVASKEPVKKHRG